MFYNVAVINKYDVTDGYEICSENKENVERFLSKWIPKGYEIYNFEVFEDGKKVTNVIIEEKPEGYFIKSFNRK